MVFGTYGTFFRNDKTRNKIIWFSHVKRSRDLEVTSLFGGESNLDFK